jgi:hypothetical protein
MPPADRGIDVVQTVSTTNHQPKSSSLRSQAPAVAETRSLMNNVG